MPSYFLTNAVGFDSIGAPLPEGFEYYAQTISQGPEGPTSITSLGLGGTYIQTFTYTNGLITAISPWVKS